ncbi:MAG TPA: hypothetical protein PLV01_09420, partial [Candidatus Kapabacteria bacterium]|nr:hypothetical protein [Candidatus Kapabacteria bacterium]
NLFILFIVSIVLSSELFSAGIDIQEIEVEQIYYFRLVNGDVITARVLEKNIDNEQFFIKINTIIGTATIFENEIVEIRKISQIYRHNNRIFLLPTALPIDNHHFVGNFELGFFYAGIGIWDYFSLYAGHSILPFAYPNQEISSANLKFSYPAMSIKDIPATIWLGGGANLAFINSGNKFVHYYANATYQGEKSTVSAIFFLKNGNKDVYPIRFKNELYDLTYPNGSFGVGLGLDTKFSSRNDLHFIGELWNSDVNNPSNTLILLGIRLSNTKFSSDFGLGFITEPIAFPFISFVWTPF